MFRSSLQPMWDLIIHPLWGPHRPVIGSNTICNSPSPPLAYRHQPEGVKTCLLERGFHTLIRNVLFLSLTNMGSHNPPSPAFSLAHHPVIGYNTICNSPSPPLADIVHFGLLHIAISLKGIKTCLRSHRLS